MGHCNCFSDLAIGYWCSLRSFCGTYSNIFERYEKPISTHSLLTSDLATNLSLPGLDFYECILPLEEINRLNFWK